MLLRRASTLDLLPETDAVWTHVTDTLGGLGIDRFIYLTVDQNFKNPVLLTNIAELYEGSDPASDPFLSHCCHSYDITLTGPAYLPDYAYLPDAAKAFIKTARALGFESGLGIPMRLQGSERFGGFNIGTSLPRPEFEKKILPRAEELRTFCLLAHRRLEELMDASGPRVDSDQGRDRMIAPESETFAALSPREREVAYLIANGYSRKECARLCSLSTNTVSDYVKSLYRKLGINNRSELTAIAYRSAPTPQDTPPI